VHARERRVDRYYDPATAQFISVDPLVAETQSPYGYTGDDPLNGADPDGLSFWDPSWLNKAADTTWNGIKSFATGLVGTPRGCGTNGAAYDVGNAVWWSAAFIGFADADQGDNSEDSGGSPLPSPNFVEPTNPPQLPPTDLPEGYSVRIESPTEQYENGYWVETNESGQPVDPSTGKPPSNVTRAVSRSMTHVPLPPSG
jgi:hypothetical protein